MNDIIYRAGRLEFQNPLLSGAGNCKTLQQAQTLLRSAVAGVELGSITPQMLNGNEGDNFYAAKVKGVLLYTMNSLGMPNPGKVSTEGVVLELVTYARKHGKCFGINVAAETATELVEMVHWATGLGVDWVTINPACPNRFVDGVPASILYYDLEAVREFTQTLHELAGEIDVEVWWKNSPDSDTLGHQPKVMDLVAECDAITGIVSNNTLPHCYDQLDGNDAIKMVYGGLAGPAVRPKALGDIKRLRARYGERFTYIGAGGVTSGDDIMTFLDSGADVVQATSIYWANEQDPRIFGEILEEFATRFLEQV